jgi:hypothetical protein
MSASSPVKRLPDAVKENIKKSPVFKKELPLGEKQVIRNECFGDGVQSTQKVAVIIN